MSRLGSVPRLTALLLWGAAVAAGLGSALLQNGNRTLAVRAQRLAVSSPELERLAMELELRNREGEAALDSVEPTLSDRSNEDANPRG